MSAPTPQKQRGPRKVNLPIPLTCKELLNLKQIEDSSDVGLGTYPITSGMIVGMLVANDEGPGYRTISVEDSTGLVTDLKVYNQMPLLDNDDSSFKYITVNFTITSSADGGYEIYVASIHLVQDYYQVTEHLMKAYVFYLANILPQRPYDPYEKFLKEKKSSQGHQQDRVSSLGDLAGSISMNYNQTGSMQQNMGFTNHMSGNPTQRAEAFVQSISSDSSFTLDQFQQQTGLTRQEASDAIEQIVESGMIYIGTDDNTFHVL